MRQFCCYLTLQIAEAVLNRYSESQNLNSTLTMPNSRNIQAPSQLIEPYLRFRPYPIPERTGSTSDSENGKTDETVTVCSPEKLLRIMFENQNGEWEMVASDGTVFKFHQCVLEDQNEHFRTLFSHHGTKECVGKRIVIPPEENLPGPAVEAFLRYMYYKDTEGMEISFSIASALVRAGHCYNIPELVKLAAERIEWYSATADRIVFFNVKELWELYQHVSLWEDTHPSKRRLIHAFRRCAHTYVMDGKDRDELLELTNGNVALRDFLVALAGHYASEWQTVGIEVMIKVSHPVTGLRRQTGVIRKVLVGAFAVFLFQKERTVNVQSHQLVPTIPKSGDRVQIIGTDHDGAIGCLESTWREYGVVSFHGNIKFFPFSFLARVVE